jgi:1-acyl-sn-glycerol-3-phosphate acyltransferase
VLIFPEGTRVPHGQTPRLQAGFAGLYARLAMPVVPVATDAGTVWSRSFAKRPGTIRLRFAEPIPAGLPRRDIEARVHAAINALNAETVA